MIPSYACRQEPRIYVSWRLHPATDGGKWRDSQANIKQNPGSSVEECDRSKQDRGVKDTTWKPTESIALNHKGSQSLVHQPGNMQELELDPLHICSKCPAWCSYGSPNKWNQTVSFPGIGSTPLPLLGLPGWASVEEHVLSPAGNIWARVRWYPPSLRRRWGGNGERDMRGWDWEERRWGIWSGGKVNLKKKRSSVTHSSSFLDFHRHILLQRHPSTPDSCKDLPNMA